MKKKIVIIVLLSVLSVVLVCYLYPVNAGHPKAIEVAEPLMEYGLAVDSFCVQSARIENGQTLGGIFTSIGVKPHIVNQLNNFTVDGFGARNIKAGHIYKVFYTPDSLMKPQYVVYQESAVNFYVFSVIDTLNGYRFEKEVDTVLKVSHGQISSSLWETMEEQGINPVLALDMSDVFAWCIDFFGLYTGDRFRVMYDELYVDTVSLGIGRIHAAWFEHRNEMYYAFGYEQDSTYSFWDEAGNSLRKSFLKAPLRFSRISSRYTGRRFHPILKIYRPHLGVDYAAPAGTPVVAIGDGVVIKKSYSRSAGNYVKIKHNSVYTTGYNHFSKYAKGIAPGTRVKQGQVIGYVGSTGYATGPHLDFRFWKNGKLIDPLKVESPAVEPIKNENINNFQQIRDSLLWQLDSTKTLAPITKIDTIKNQNKQKTDNKNTIAPQK